MNDQSQGPPPGWGNDNISKYLKDTYENAFYIYDEYRVQYELLRDLIDLYFEVSGFFKGLDEKKLMCSAFFFLMAKSSFLSSIRLATGGQLPDSYKCIRGCLESSAYGHYIFGSEDGCEKFRVWSARIDSEEAEKKARNEFKWRNIINLIKIREPKYAPMVEELYHRTIKYGAHPNPGALFTDLETLLGDTPSLTFQYITNIEKDPIPFLLCIKSIAEVGIVSLRIYEEIFFKRFQIIGASDRLAKISAEIYDRI